MRISPSLFALGLSIGCVSEHGPLTNHMAQAATPYLARAAHQPVSWQQWGPEAFALAARLDRPILLYVGADDCRWCGRMDREVYGDGPLGAMIDSLFVPIRVDRDERPDIADRYAAAVRVLSGLRGYPLTVFLTPDGSAFFGGTYFPLDDPVTGRGLRQIVPEVAKSFRLQHASILQRAALVRQLAERRGPLPHGVLQPAAVRGAIDGVRAALAASGRTGTGLGGFLPAEAAGLLIAVFARTGDSSYLVPARAVLDYAIDSAEAAVAESARDDPPGPVRAALLRDFASAWAVTGDPRYEEGARDLVRRLEGETEWAGDRPVFADREAYVIGAILDAAPAVGDSAAALGARSALDTLLKRAYAPGRGVRHVAGGSGVRALLGDQVQVAAACLAAYQSAGDARYLGIARDLAAVLERDFADSVAGGYFDVAASDPAVLAPADRAKPVLDDLLPGANAMAARVLLRLTELTGDPRYGRRGAAALEAFAGSVAGEGMRASTYLAAAQDALGAR